MALFFTILLGCKGEAKKETKVNTTKEVLKKIGVQEINNDEGKLWKLVEYDSLGIQINNYIEYTEEGELKKYYYYDLKGQLRFKRIYSSDGKYRDEGKCIYVGFSSKEKSNLKVGETLPFSVFTANVPNSMISFDLLLTYNDNSTVELINKKVINNGEVLKVPLMFKSKDKITLSFISTVYDSTLKVNSRVDKAQVELNIN
tara:strand:- start:376 stop:978 length:603 start_codon:yes stop_codon:yes gene_type:complete